MATPIPAALKSADISRFALRAAQLEKAKPIIAYWSNYWIVNNIISNNLQNADEESKQYTMNIMDKLEHFKTAHAEEDAITDDLAGKAYIEQFGLETFQRADNAVRANKASRQTADTFQASATFLELLQIFGALELEISQKIKFAKYHALRIAKALKAGEDPNLSNPIPEPDPEDQIPALDKSDIDMIDSADAASKPGQPSIQEIPDEADKVQSNLAQTSTLDQSLHPSRDSSVPRPPGPSVQDVTDEADRAQRILAQRSVSDESLHPSRASSIPRPPGAKVEDALDDTDRASRSMAQQSSLDESLHPSRAPSMPGTSHVDPTSAAQPAVPSLKSPSANDESFYTSAAPTGPPPYVSPLDPPTSAARASSVGGNYFPEVPSPPSPPAVIPGEASAPPPDLPSAPQTFPSFQPPPPTDITQSQPPPFLPQNSTIPPPVQHPHATPRSFQAPPTQPTPQTQSFYRDQPAAGVPQPPTKTSLHQQPPSTANSASNVPAVVDEEAMMKAQKHARWAISALNFEDVGTAVQELRGALEALGAR